MAPNSQEQLLALRATGVRLAIDDFGTGHSSLSRLAVLPVNTLKVDRSFVRDIPAVGDAPLVRAMIAMAHSLGLTVVAEGIETERQRDYLTDLGCEHGQGYLFSRPVPAAGAGQPPGPRSRVTAYGPGGRGQLPVEPCWRLVDRSATVVACRGVPPRARA